jgi:hypothetical protein
MATVEVDELLETLDEDLLDDPNADGMSVGSEDRNTDNSGGMLQTLSAPNANDFPNARLIEELEGRRIRPTGAKMFQVLCSYMQSVHSLTSKLLSK